MSTFNRLHNASNPYQGKSKRVLCVCSAGLLRSPTAAHVLHKEYGHNTRAAGLDESHALIPVDSVLLSWADEIICMDGRQKRGILVMCEREGVSVPPIQVLGIDDNFAYMDKELQSLIIKNYINVEGELH